MPCGLSRNSGILLIQKNPNVWGGRAGAYERTEPGSITFWVRYLHPYRRRAHGHGQRGASIDAISGSLAPCIVSLDLSPPLLPHFLANHQSDHAQGACCVYTVSCARCLGSHHEVCADRPGQRAAAAGTSVSEATQLWDREHQEGSSWGELLRKVP